VYEYSVLYDLLCTESSVLDGVQERHMRRSRMEYMKCTRRAEPKVEIGR
jgi:hypothetical protein